MIVTVLNRSYKLSSENYGIDIPNLEFKLNLILNREKSTWPEPKDTRTEEEINSGVPAPEATKELKEGDVFMLDNTLFGLGKDKLIFILSESGPLAAERIFEEKISPELDFLYFNDEYNNYSWDDELKDLPEGLEKYTPKYEWMNIWHENFFEGKNLRENPIIRVSIEDDMLKETRYIYMTKWDLYYSKEDFDSDEIPYYTHQIMCYFKSIQS